MSEPSYVLRLIRYQLKPDEDRQLLISKILLSNTYREDIDDIQRFMHDFLSCSINDFKLEDTLYGLETFMSIYAGGIQRAEVFARHQIDDGCHFIKYAQLEYKTEITDV